MLRLLETVTRTKELLNDRELKLLGDALVDYDESAGKMIRDYLLKGTDN